MPTLTVNGHSVQVDDGFLNLSPDQQNATVDEIAKSLGGDVGEPQQMSAAGGATTPPSTGTPPLKDLVGSVGDTMPGLSTKPWTGDWRDDFLYGVSQPINRGAELIARGAANVFPGQVGREASSAADYMQGLQQRMQQGHERLRPGGGSAPAQAIGQMFATAPIGLAMPGAAAPSLLARAASGAASGALTGAVTDENPGRGAIMGGALGAATPAILSGLSNIVRGVQSPNAALLRGKGITPTPGQIMGGAANRMEQGIESIPITGDFIKNARLRPVLQMNEAAVNDVLSPIGEKLSVPVGSRDAMAEMVDKVSGVYKAAVPQAGAKLDATAVNDLQKLHQLSQFMPADRRSQFDAVLRAKVLDNISPNGFLSGESFKDAESFLGREASNYLHSPDADQRTLGGAYQELQSILRNSLQRASPDNADAIQAANAAYAKMLRVLNASGRSAEGTFSPAQLQAGVKKYAVGKQYETGRALMQPFADAARAVLGPTVPDSGTPFRHAMQVGGGLLGTLLGGHAVGIPEAGPVAAAALGIPAALSGALYSPLGTRLAASALMSRPEFAGPLADAIRAASPAATAAVPAGLLGQAP